MRIIEPLEYGKFYHIYNRGVNSCNLFRDNDNYEYFLGLYDHYISPIADTFAWVLMKNHFHFLVRIKEEEEIGYLSKQTRSGWKTTKRETTFVAPSVVTNPDGGLQQRKYKPSNQFSHLFNAYAQAINKRYLRTGSLFDHPFKRKLIDNETYLKKVLLYIGYRRSSIHNNPVHHGFCEHPMDYPWSSYQSCVSVKPTKLHRDSVIGWFDDDANFKSVHNQTIDIQHIEKWLDI